MMKGLLLKEFYSMKGQIKIWLALYLFYVILSATGEDVGLLFAIIPMLTVIVGANMLSFDASYKWDMYVRCLPVKCSQVVFSQYLAILLLSLGTTALSLICSAGLLWSKGSGFFAQNWGETAGTAGGCLMAAVLLVSLLFPLIYKFGVEKSRYIFILVGLAPVMGALVLEKAGLLEGASNEAVADVMGGMLLLVPVLLGLSLWLSIRFYARKEF